MRNRVRKVKNPTPFESLYTGTKGINIPPTMPSMEEYWATQQ